MIKLKYACIARDKADKKLVVVSTHWEPTKGVRGRCIDGRFHRFALSIFALHPEAVRVEVMSLDGWKPGVDVETLSWVVTASRDEEMRALSPRALRFSFPEQAESVEA